MAQPSGTSCRLTAPSILPPLTKQKKNENKQTPTHPQIHYKFYYSPHTID